MTKIPLVGLLLAATLPGAYAFTYIGNNVGITGDSIAKPNGSDPYITSSNLVFTGNIAGGPGAPIMVGGTDSWIEGDRSTGPTSSYGEVTFTAVNGYAIDMLGFLPAMMRFTPANITQSGTYNLSLDVQYQVDNSGIWLTHTFVSSNASGGVGDNLSFYFSRLDLDAPATTLTVRISNFQLNHVGGDDVFADSWEIHNFQIIPGASPFSPIPEPATVSLGLAGLALLARRRRLT